MQKTTKMTTGKEKGGRNVGDGSDFQFSLHNMFVFHWEGGKSGEKESARG